MADGKKEAKIPTRKKSRDVTPVSKRKKTPKASRGKHSGLSNKKSQKNTSDKSPEPTPKKSSAPLLQKFSKKSKEKPRDKSPEPTCKKPSAMLLQKISKKSKEKLSDKSSEPICKKPSKLQKFSKKSKEKPSDKAPEPSAPLLKKYPKKSREKPNEISSQSIYEQPSVPLLKKYPKKLKEKSSKKFSEPTCEKPSAPLLQTSPEKSEDRPTEKLPEPTCEKPSAPPLQNSPEKSPPTAPLQKHSKSTLNKILKREDEKYVGIDFDVPPPVWTKEDKSKMREVMRSISIMHKKQANKDRVSEIALQVRSYRPEEMALAREIFGLLQKDTNLMNHMELKHVSFSTFSKNTYDWNRVADLLNSKHTPAECKEYWYMDLYPRIKNMGFTEANDKQLMELAIENKFQNWDKIADGMIGHTEYQCYVHFRRNLYKKMIQDVNKGLKLI